MRILDRKFVSLIGGTLLLGATLAMAGQPNRAQSTELHLRFEAISPVPGDIDQALQFWPRHISEQGQTFKAEPPPRPPRSQELGPDQLRVEAIDARGHVRYFQHLPDPRIRRAEFPPEGQTTGPIESITIITEDADFIMPLPVNEPGKPPITELRIYQRAPQGEDYELHLLGTLPVR